jgi:hypothetical protein
MYTYMYIFIEINLYIRKGEHVNTYICEYSPVMLARLF